MRGLAGRLPRPLLDHVPPVVHESAAVRTRRKRVVAATAVAGSALLGRAFIAPPGSRQFSALTLGLAGTWTLGGVLSGPLHLGHIQGRDDQLRRPVLTPVATGVAAFGCFYAAAHVVRRIPVLDEALSHVLAYAEQGDPRTVTLSALANGAAEEVFFRGALYAATTHHHPVLATTLAYSAGTVVTRNPALVAAAAAMGTLFGLQRQASGGIQASVLTHLTWSWLMLRYLPRVRSRS